MGCLICVYNNRPLCSTVFQISNFIKYNTNASNCVDCYYVSDISLHATAYYQNGYLYLQSGNKAVKATFVVFQHSVSQRGVVTMTTNINDNVVQVKFNTPIETDYVVITSLQFPKFETWGWHSVTEMVYNKTSTGFTMDVWNNHQEYQHIQCTINWIAIPLQHSVSQSGDWTVFNFGTDYALATRKVYKDTISATAQYGYLYFCEYKFNAPDIYNSILYADVKPVTGNGLWFGQYREIKNTTTVVCYFSSATSVSKTNMYVQETVIGKLKQHSVSQSKLLWSGSVWGGESFGVPELKEYTFVEVVCSNNDENHWGVLCFNDMNALKPTDNGYCIWVCSDMHAGQDYLVSIKSKLEIQKDLKTVKFAAGWAANIMRENTTVTSTHKIRIIAIYGVRQTVL